jgi:hypothetical protein
MPSSIEALREKLYRLNARQFACKLPHMNTLLAPQTAVRLGLAGTGVVVHQGAFSRSSRSR